MNGKSKSREHHWWPVGLQKYWTDRNGDVSWIDPDGFKDKKRAKNRKIGYSSHGHTLFRGNVWETNFEHEFQSADDAVPKVVPALIALKPLGWTIKEFSFLMTLFFKREKSLRDMCKFYRLDEDIQRGLLLLIFSLLIRSPASRFKYSQYGSKFGLPPDDETAKANMRQSYLLAKKLCENGRFSNQYFVLLHSPIKRFFFGDGSLDWLSGSLSSNRITGRALVPLTPHLCVYFCTPLAMRTTPNCASLSVAPWMVDWINEIVQIYSRDKLFFLGKAPKLTNEFRQRKFLEHKNKTDELIVMLDEIAGNTRSGFGLTNIFRPNW